MRSPQLEPQLLLPLQEPLMVLQKKSGGYGVSSMQP